MALNDKYSEPLQQVKDTIPQLSIKEAFQLLQDLSEMRKLTEAHFWNLKSGPIAEASPT